MTPNPPVVDEKPNTLLAVFAAMVPLVAFPTGLVLAAIASGLEFMEMITRAGAAAYGVIGLGMMATLAVAVIAFMAGRVARIPGPIAAFPVVLPVLYGVLGVSQGVTGTLEAIVHVNPADKATITCAGFSEALQSAVLGFDVSAACAGGAAVALLLAALARRSAADRPYRFGLIASAMVFFGASWVLLFHAGLSGELAQGYSAVANVSPADKLTVLAAAAEGVGRNEVLSLGALGFMGLLSVGGLALGLLRAKSPAAVATTVVMVAAALGAQAWVDALQRKVEAFVVEGAPKHPPLIHLEGWDDATLAGLIVTGDEVQFEGSRDHDPLIAALVKRKAQYEDLHQLREGDPSAAYPLMVAADATPIGFNRAIDVLRAAGYDALQLVGDAPVDKARFAALPARMRPMMEAMSSGPRWFRVELISVEAFKTCEPCAVAQIEGDQLILVRRGQEKEPHPLAWFPNADESKDPAVFGPCKQDVQKYVMAMSTVRGQHRMPAIMVE